MEKKLLDLERDVLNVQLLRGAMVKDVPLAQGSSNISLQVQSAAEFSSNPDQTHLPVIF